ncbi:MAG: PHP domain-containing protein, partial [Desulfamplus sp.]|nr:PHP domain-containing protein [Desulfamplus sp.]
NESDGDLSPEELVQNMKALGIAVVGVTDHDTDKGLERAVAEGTRIGVRIVTGVEMSVRFKEELFTGTLHLLCYFNPELLKDSRFRQTLKETLEKGRGDALVRARVNEINKFFGKTILARELTFEEIASYSPTITRRHFALALNQKHGIQNPDIVNQIIGNESPAYLPSGVELESIKEFTEQFPVLTVIAHPAAGSFPGEGHYKEVLPPIETVEKLLPRFLSAGMKGIEINYPGHIESHREILRTWAVKHKLIVTGGSDCHDLHLRPPGVEGITREEFENFSTLMVL